MQQNVICLTSEFIDLENLNILLSVKPFLSQFTQDFHNASLTCKNVVPEMYMGFSIPLQKIETILRTTTNPNIVIISKYNVNIPFLKFEEALMTKYPKFSFLVRNTVVEYKGNDVLLNSKYGTILFVALYNAPNKVVTIKIK